jgi:hypothetical protein
MLSMEHFILSRSAVVKTFVLETFCSLSDFYARCLFVCRNWHFLSNSFLLSECSRRVHYVHDIMFAICSLCSRHYVHDVFIMFMTLCSRHVHYVHDIMFTACSLCSRHYVHAMFIMFTTLCSRHVHYVHDMFIMFTELISAKLVVCKPFPPFLCLWSDMCHIGKSLTTSKTDCMSIVGYDAGYIYWDS